MSADESYNNYLSHNFTSSPVHDSLDREVFCAECGVENLGDPREFDWLEYPPCERSDP